MKNLLLNYTCIKLITIATGLLASSSATNILRTGFVLRGSEFAKFVLENEFIVSTVKYEIVNPSVFASKMTPAYNIVFRENPIILLKTFELINSK